MKQLLAIAALFVNTGAFAQTSAIPHPANCLKEALSAYTVAVATGIQKESAGLAGHQDPISIGHDLANAAYNAHQVNTVLFLCGYGPNPSLAMVTTYNPPPTVTLSYLANGEIANDLLMLNSYGQRDDFLDASIWALNLTQIAEEYSVYPHSVTNY